MRPARLLLAHCLSGLLLAAFPFAGVPAYADNWSATIYDAGSPQHIVGVDKKRHTFNFFEKKSPLKLRYTYPCVTGQIPGDKRQVNDLRTPEGIYFVEYKIASGLDFREYGGIAYTLNYPNPVDRLRGKTGHGIWIHSKGFELAPTRGCVAIDRDNIAEVGPFLVPGTPVVLAEELKPYTVADDDTLNTLRELMTSWSNTWAARSPDLFSFYDPDAYTRATENFAAFRQNKERLFKILTFIKIYNREIHVLEGPGYWVTWAEQLYTASNLSTEGVRRLYWQKESGGDFKIVGMEWIPRDVGMRSDFQKGRLVAEGPVSAGTDAGSELPQAPRLDMPEEAMGANMPVMATREKDGVMAGLTASIGALTEKLVALSEPLVPGRQTKTPAPDEIVWGSGKRLTETGEDNAAPTPQLVLPTRGIKRNPLQPATISDEKAAASGQEAMQPEKIEPEPEQKTVAPRLAEPQIPVDEKKDPVIMAADSATLAELRKAVAAWEKAYVEKNAAIYDLYDKKKFNRLPADLGITSRMSLASIIKGIQHDFSRPWLKMISQPPKLAVNGSVAHTETALLLVGPESRRQGIQHIWWQRDGDGGMKIVGSDFEPKDMGLEANYLENISGDISRMLEAWRKSWEDANLDEYMSFYAPTARQQGKTGAQSIRKQKEKLWSRVKPEHVRFSGLRIVLDKVGARADMNQSYADSAGKADKGIKTVLLRYDGKKWLIQSEDWVNQIQTPVLNR